LSLFIDESKGLLGKFTMEAPVLKVQLHFIFFIQNTGKLALYITSKSKLVLLLKKISVSTIKNLSLYVIVWLFREPSQFLIVQIDENFNIKDKIVL